MLNRITGAALVSVAAVSATIILPAQQRPAPVDRAPAPIRLRAATFTPARGERPAIRPELTIGGYGAGQRGYYLVQFEGPIRDEWKADLAAAGAEILEYVPEFAFKVRMTPGEANRVEGLGPVAWVGLFEPAYKLGPDLARNGGGLYTVRIERGADAAAAAAAVLATGAQIVRRAGALITVAAEADQLDAIAQVFDVAAVEALALRQKHNEFGAGVILRANAVNADGFDGSTQTIAVADTGIGHGAAASAHPHVPAARIRSIFNWPGAPDACFETIVDDGAADVDSGHGTHVATSALGSGGPDGAGRGTAPAAGLVFQAIENWATPSFMCEWFYGIPSGYYLVGIPDNLGDLFQQGYDAGARIHSNSWGSDVSGAYTADSANTDAFVWNRRDMAITLSAGNSGVDANGDGVVDEGSLSSPATAKNVISVGASENDRQSRWECDSALAYTNCAATGGQNTIFTYGAAWPDRYPADPLQNDPSAGNAQQMAAFSSRGPTADGRIKPDVVAPGTWVLSGYSDRFQQQYDPSPNPQSNAYQYDGWGHPLNPTYKYMGGTSMAAPLVAGAAAVVRDYYQKARDHQASAALVKATLVNTAVDLEDENNDGIHDNAYPIPNSHEGWGRADLANATDGIHQFADEITPVSTGTGATFTFPVEGAGWPFRVTLAWTDYPSTTTAALALVNDLDLSVTAPDGTTYAGNVFAGGWSVTGGTADRTNNLENVYIAAAPAGTWTVMVTGFNVPNGPQPFALVVDGQFEGSGTQLPPVSASAADAVATEAGPTTGAFTVMRGGETTEPLVVHYTTSGTATPGSDYVALSGTVTIPEGASSATILVEPFDDASVEPDETVVLMLSANETYSVGSPPAATITIVSDDVPPDLSVTALTAPSSAAAGATITVSDTTKNQGGGPSPASETGFYLSTNTSLDGADVWLGSRPVSALAAGALESASTPLEIPAATATGTYYVLAKADWAGAIVETYETNNTRSSGYLRIGPDLLSSSLTAPATAAAGGTILVGDTTKNQGADSAPASTTAFYLSTNTSVDASDVLLGGRPVPALATGATDSASTSLVIPASTSAGSYYVLAKVDANGDVAETLETNNVRASSPVKVGADLVVTSMAAPAAAAAGGAINVTDTTKNQGGGASAASTTWFYLSANTSIDASDVFLGGRPVPALDAGVSHQASTLVTIPPSTAAGAYYIVGKADGDNTVVETTETNNTRASASLKIGPDLIVSALTVPSLAAAGATIGVSDTNKNQGGDTGAASTTSFYLSTNTSFDASDLLLGSRPVPMLVAGATASASTSLVLPASTETGTYYVIAVADGDHVVVEALETNNVRASSSIRIGPDLIVSSLSGPSSAVAGTSITIGDTTKNQGGGAADASTTTFYLSTNSTLDAADVVMGSRGVAALGGGVSESGSTVVALSSTLAPGTYLILAKADAPGAVVETLETNNTRAKSITISAP